MIKHKDKSKSWSLQKTLTAAFGFLGILGFVGWKAYFANQAAKPIAFSSQTECEEKTGKVCSFQPCGLMSNGEPNKCPAENNFFIRGWVSTTNPSLVVGSIVMVRGDIQRNVTKHAPVDGEAYLLLRTGYWTTKVIYNPGEAGCINPLARPFSLKLLQTVEVYGKVISENTISTCESKDFYIKLIDSI